MKFQDDGLGSDVPLKNLDRTISSFALQLICRGSNHGCEGSHIVEEKLNDFQDDEFMNLGSNFKELGLCMMELGLWLAWVCDRALGGQELEQSLLESYTAKVHLYILYAITQSWIMLF
ncbi:hypothetical protein NE237_015425 [Protea cynaroides]|uniref:Uncharacterized protein n=1 Tax=Protea cynaroides TaxID=273540 RepID=A0A9Q0KE73_9MAGN|nr:hypothetical protein NE237_015425 [Protea cynaroides]